MAEGRQVAKAAGLVLILNLISRLLGFVRDAVIASQFGAGKATDAYLVAYTLPYSLQAVLGMAFVTVMVPVVTSFLAREQRDEAWETSSIVMNWTVLVLSAVTLLGIFFAPLLVKVMAPGFPPVLQQLTTSLTRIMFPSILFMGLGMLVTGILNAGYIFAWPAFAPAFSNLIVILVVLLFGEQYRVSGLAWGTVVGFIGFLLVQIPSLKTIGFKYKFSWDYRHPAVKKVFAALLPVVLSVAVNQLYLALNRMFASHLSAGSITALDFANRVMNLPLGIFVAAISTAIFPAMAEQAALKNNKQLAVTVKRGMGMVILLTVPAALGLMALRLPIVRLLFERGAFDSSATLLTTQALFYFAMGLAALGMNTVLNRVYYSMDNFSIPVRMGLISVLFDVLLSFLLTPLMGHTGLALANTLASMINTLLLLLFLKGRLPIDLRGLAVTAGKVVLAGFLMVLVLGPVAGGIFSGAAAFSRQALELFFVMAVGAAVFAAAVVLLRVEEGQMLLGLVKKRK